MKEKNKKKQKIEILVIKKLTYTRILIVLFLLMSIDMLSSYLAIKHPQIYEYNNLGALAFSLGVPGLLVYYVFSIFLICSVCAFIFVMEKTLFKLQAVHFRMKCFYLILGMYVFVFLNNLKTVIQILIS